MSKIQKKTSSYICKALTRKRLIANQNSCWLMLSWSTDCFRVICDGCGCVTVYLFACIYVQITVRGRQHNHHMHVSSRHRTFSFLWNFELKDWILLEAVTQFAMPHASTEPRKVTGFWILSCCHSQEVMLLLVNVVSKGGGGGRNGAAYVSERPLSEFTGFLWFSALCVTCCRKRALKTSPARGRLHRLSSLAEEFLFSSSCPHSCGDCGRTRWIEMMLIVLTATAAVGR